MKEKIATVMILFTFLTYAQEDTGSIAGRINDKEMNNQPLPFANVHLKGTSKGTTSDTEGVFEMQRITPGVYTVSISFVGYKALEIPDITIKKGKTTIVNATLSADKVMLKEVVVTTAKRGSEVALLLNRKKAVSIRQSIGAQELSRKGVSDVETAVTKVSGVSKQEGVKNVFVRGLGDRYNSTSLNGLPLPSDDPEYKNITLDIFSSKIIQRIDLNKTFDATLFANVGGANIDIISKNMTERQTLGLQTSLGFNSQTLSKEFLKIHGTSFLGNITDKKAPVTNTDVYGFKNSYRPDTQRLQLAGGLSIVAGKKFKLGDGKLMDVFLSASMNNSYNYKDGNESQLNAQGYKGKDLDFKKYQYKLTKTVLGNFKYRFGTKNYIAYNGLFIGNSKQQITDYQGLSTGIVNEEPDVASTFIRRQQNNTNALFVHQLLSGIHFNRFYLNTGISYNTVRTYEPDRRTNTYRFTNQTQKYETVTGTSAYNNRFFSELTENTKAANILLAYRLGNTEDDKNKGNKIETGYSFKKTTRAFDATQYNHNFDRQEPVDKENPDAVFNQEMLNKGIFNLIEIGQFYSGDKHTHAALLSLTQPVGSRFIFKAGLRYEKVYQDVEWNTSISDSKYRRDAGTIDKNYILPDLSLKFTLDEQNTFRLALSKTYILPQFKEVAPFRYEDVNFSSEGNPALKISDIYHADIKWDYYPGRNEILSLTAFYKNIKNPINRVYVASAAYVLSYINPGEHADVAGVELELKKKIFEYKNAGSRKMNLLFGLNASYLYSKQQLTNTDANFTDKEAALQGASPLLLNTDLTYGVKNKNFRSTASLVLNYFSTRIYSLGSQKNNNIMEKGIPTLDFVFNVAFNKHISLGFNAKNLLNPEYRLTQRIDDTDVVIRNYNKGTRFNLNLEYKF